MRTVALIQARTSSVRLPGKVLLDLNGYPLLWHVINRTRQAKTLDGVVVATTTDPADEAICRLAENMGVPYFRGSRDDVLGRLYECAKEHKADVVVRITGDCPMIDSEIIDLCVTTLRRDSQHYVTNTLPPESWPDGTDVEAFTIQALQGTWQNATLQSDRGHVTPGMRRNLPGKYIGALVYEYNLAHLRFCIDDPQDLVFARAVFAELGNASTWMDVVKLLERKPEIAALMGTAKRNEGYEKSLREDSSAV